MTTIGLFVDLRQLPSSDRSPAAHVSHTLDLLAHSETLGCDAIWFTEHHGFADGYLPQPLVMAAAVASRTSTMRLGTAVTLAPLRHPRHVAEEAALVDLVSGGRLELGIGAGYAPGEFEMFDVDMADRVDRTGDTVQAVRELLESGELTPGPVQRPVPLWLGYQGPKGAHRAGLAGTGLLSLDPSLVGPYRDGLAKGGHDRASARMGGLVEIIVSDDPERTTERLIPHWVHQQNTYRSIRRPAGGTRIPVVTADDARRKLDATGRLGNLLVLDVPATVAELSHRINAVPARHVYTWLSLADMPDDIVECHVERWCGPVREQVPPALDALTSEATGPVA
jgi:alkanesulfonate monooxygenase SsuD/methylene tetrahydromethanopterin reductase-like flavin-dependent oxidoreductase (luciferase family)